MDYKIGYLGGKEFGYRKTDLLIASFYKEIKGGKEVSFLEDAFIYTDQGLEQKLYNLQDNLLTQIPVKRIQQINELNDQFKILGQQAESFARRKIELDEVHKQFIALRDAGFPPGEGLVQQSQGVIEQLEMFFAQYGDNLAKKWTEFFQEQSPLDDERNTILKQADRGSGLDLGERIEQASKSAQELFQRIEELDPRIAQWNKRLQARDNAFNPLEVRIQELMTLCRQQSEPLKKWVQETKRRAEESQSALREQKPAHPEEDEDWLLVKKEDDASSLSSNNEEFELQIMNSRTSSSDTP